MRVYLFQTFERFFVLFIRKNYPRDNYVRAKTMMEKMEKISKSEGIEI